MKMYDILEAKSANRELWDKIKSKGVVPGFDREKYQARDGLEGPFRLRNGKVVYYDPQEGSYYDPDTDMYISYDDYRKMDEQGVAEGDIPSSRGADTMGAGLGASRSQTTLESKSISAAAKKSEAQRQSLIKKAARELNFKTKPTTAEKLVKKYDLFTSDAAAITKMAKELSKVQEGDERPKYVVTTKDKPKKIKPSMGGESPHPYQGKLVGATESSQWGEPKDVLAQVLQTLEREVEWPLTDVMDPQQVKQLLSPLMQAVSQQLNSLDEAEVGSTDYEYTHGKKPAGQGSWFFVAHRGGVNFSKDVEGEDYIQLNQMSYGDAKKAAVKWAKSKGHTSLFVAT